MVAGGAWTAAGAADDTEAAGVAAGAEATTAPPAGAVGMLTGTMGAAVVTAGLVPALAATTDTEADSAPMAVVGCAGCAGLGRSCWAYCGRAAMAGL